MLARHNSTHRPIAGVARIWSFCVCAALLVGTGAALVGTVAFLIP
jgi:hypothetical protein